MANWLALGVPETPWEDAEPNDDNRRATLCKEAAMANIMIHGDGFTRHDLTRGSGLDPTSPLICCLIPAEGPLPAAMRNILGMASMLNAVIG